MDRKGDWKQTFTGKQFWPMDPRPEDFDILDIAHALANTCRYGGHVKRFYSVAEHCVLLSYKVPYRLSFAALMHDFAEAYIGDMVRPLKVFMPEFKAIERHIEAIGAPVFGLSYPWPEEVMSADTRILTDERHQLMAVAPIPWGTDGDPLGVTVQCWTPEVAKARFLQRFHELGKVR